MAIGKEIKILIIAGITTFIEHTDVEYKWLLPLRKSGFIFNYVDVCVDLCMWMQYPESADEEDFRPLGADNILMPEVGTRNS